MNKYLKITLSTGASFGTAMGLFYAYQQGNFIYGLAGGLVAGILFGSAIAIISYGADRKLRAKGASQGNSSVRQFRALEANRPIKDIFPICKDALLSIKKCKVKNENQEIGAI